MVSHPSNHARVSYVIPPPTQPPPRLALPPLGASRHGRIRPLVIPVSPSTPTTKYAQSRLDGHLQAQIHPRHRLGITSLTLDVSTQLFEKASPEGILYSGGRDGQILAWDLGLKTKRRRHRYGYSERGFGSRKARWEILTGWGDDMDEEDEPDDEVIGGDGDILGDVVDSGGRKRRKSEALTLTIPYEETWELDSDGVPPPSSAFRQCMQTHTDWVNDIILCNLNQTVVSASSDGSVRAWSPHLSSSTDPVLIGMHEDYVRCLATSPHQPWIASGSFDRTIKLWDLSRTLPSSSPSNSSTPSVTSLTPLSTLSLSIPTQKSSIYAIATDQFGSIIASGSPERVIRMWDPRTGKRIGKLVGHTDIIRAVVLSADGRYLLTGSADASIKLWSLATQRCLHTFAHHTDSVWALSSQHPSLEIFYSGDRAGIVSRVDMEGCNTIDEGECLVICNATDTSEVDNTDRSDQTSILGDTCRLQDGTGINKIVSLDDRLIWTATGSSSIKRWKVPPQRSLRTGMQSMLSSSDSTTFGSGVVSNSRRTSVSSDVHSPRRGLGVSYDNSPRRSEDLPAPAASPTSPRSGKNLSTSTSVSFPGDPLSQDDTTLFGIPYQSLVRLVSPNDPYALGSPLSGRGYGGALRVHGDVDVATLYSAASVKSIPLPVAPQSHPPLVGIAPDSALRASFRQNTGSTLSPRFMTSPSDFPEANWVPSPRAEYERRDLAATALPLETYPDDMIRGEHGLVRSIILNDRMHALTIDTAGCVAIWDIPRCHCIGWFDRGDVLAEMGCADGTDRSTESDNEFRSPRELLETVRERIEGESVIAPWSTVDTRIGNLIVHLSEKSFETEIYADEAGYGSERYYDTEQRLNVAKWVLSNLFDGFVREELRVLRRIMPSLSHSPPSTQPGGQRGGSPGHLALSSRSSAHSSSEAETRSRSLSVLSATSNESNTSRSAVSTLVTVPSMAPAMLPDMSLAAKRRTSVSLVAPLIPIVTVKDAQLSPIPQSPANVASMTAGTPTPRPRREAIETPSLTKSAPNKEPDYFSMKTKRQSTATTPDDFSGWGGPGSKEKDKETHIPQAPSTPGSGGGFMGRLRHFGKSSKRPLSGDMVNTPGASTVSRNSESRDGVPKEAQSNESDPETDQSRFLGSLLSQGFHPPTVADAPPLSLPLETEIVLAEETQSGWSNVYRGTVASTGQDAALLEKVMPLWLMQYLLANKIPIIPNIKVSFGVAAWPGKSTVGEPSTDSLNPPARLTANRHLRVRKILAYVQDKIDTPPSRSGSRSGSISGATPRSSMDAPRAARSGSASSQSHTHHAGSPSHKTDVDGSKKPRPEDIYELLCNDVVLPLNMTLASIRHYIWRSSAELLLFYRKRA